MTIKDPNFLAEMRGVAMDPGSLETLGKSAAALSESGAMSLSTAVVQTIGKTKLNAEQVRRVVEFANHTAFERKYASMDPSMRVVDIEGGPADPVQVLQDLNDGARPAHTVLQSNDYVLPPSGDKTASVDFGLGYISEDITAVHRRTVGQVQALRSKLSSAQEELSLMEGSNRFQMVEAFRQLQEDVRVAVKTAGLTREDLIEAWSSINLDLVEPTLMDIGPLPTRSLGTKVAHQVNPAHPVVSGYRNYADFAQKFAQSMMARKDIERQLIQVAEFSSKHEVG